MGIDRNLYLINVYTLDLVFLMKLFLVYYQNKDNYNNNSHLIKNKIKQKNKRRRYVDIFQPTHGPLQIH